MKAKEKANQLLTLHGSKPKALEAISRELQRLVQHKPTGVVEKMKEWERVKEELIKLKTE